MKIVCDKGDLLSGVNIVLKAVPSKSAMPIMECILIDASENTISLTANNMELGIQTSVDGMILEPGTAALDAKLFSEIIRKLPSGDVYIDIDDSLKATITCEKSKFNIVGKSSGEFSKLPEVERVNSFTIPQLRLKDIIRQTIFSVADNDINKTMTGELFEISDGKLKVIALDGHRIAIRQIELFDPCEDTKIIVPGKALQEISKIISGTTVNDMIMYTTQNHILFEFGNTVVVSRLIVGKYFDVNRMLNNNFETRVVINKSDFIDTLDRSTLMVREGDRKPVIISTTDDSMRVQITSRIGSMDEEIEIEKAGPDIRTGFNPRFIMDALKSISDEYVTLYMSGGTAPCHIKDDAGTYDYIILPISIRK